MTTDSQKDWLEKLFAGMLYSKYVLAGLFGIAFVFWLVSSIVFCGSFLHNDKMCEKLSLRVDVAKIVTPYIAASKEQEYKDALSKQSVTDKKALSYQRQCQEGSNYVIDRMLVDVDYRKVIEECFTSGKLWFECYSPVTSPARDQELRYDETQTVLSGDDLKRLGFNPKHFSHEAFCN